MYSAAAAPTHAIQGAGLHGAPRYEGLSRRVIDTQRGDLVSP